MIINGISICTVHRINGKKVSYKYISCVPGVDGKMGKWLSFVNLNDALVHGLINTINLT